MTLTSITLALLIAQTSAKFRPDAVQLPVLSQFHSSDVHTLLDPRSLEEEVSKTLDRAKESERRRTQAGGLNSSYQGFAPFVVCSLDEEILGSDRRQVSREAHALMSRVLSPWYLRIESTTLLIRLHHTKYLPLHSSSTHSPRRSREIGYHEALCCPL